MKRIALATSETFASLTDDDRLLIEPLNRCGVAAKPAVWTHPRVPWNSFEAVIIRSCWDYHLRLPEFLGWISRLENSGTRIWNPPDMIRWNADKTYLRDLESKAIPIVPTFWPDRRVKLRDQLHKLGWNQAVVKPRV